MSQFLRGHARLGEDQIMLSAPFEAVSEQRYKKFGVEAPVISRKTILGYRRRVLTREHFLKIRILERRAYITRKGRL